MNICLVKVPSALAERIRADPDLLNQVWPVDEDEPAAPDAEIAAIDEEDDTLFEGSGLLPAAIRWRLIKPRT